MSRWYKRCGADFIHGTMMLTLEEKGAYSLCLDLIYDRGGPIPDDARWLSGVCGVSMRKWGSLRDRLISIGKLSAENGLLSNSRAAFELVSSELQRRNQAEAGAKGGRKSAENRAAPKENNGLSQATLKPIEESRGEEIRIDKKEGFSSSGDDAPPSQISELRPEHVVEAWNDMATRTGLPKVRVLTPERRERLNARIRQHPIEDFTEAISAIERSSFLRGDDKWRGANFDFLLSKSKFVRLIEGSYDH